MSSVKTFTVSSEGVVSGNKTVDIGSHFELLEQSGSYAIHAWQGNVDKCAEVCGQCPLPCNTHLKLKDHNKFGAKYQLGTDPANDGGRPAIGPQASNGTLTVGGG